VSRTTDVVDLLGTSWTQILHHVEDGVLILDSQRTLKFANQRARQLLGYNDDQQVGGRCRLTTRGLDCENACPLTFALEGGLRQVENFSTVYHTNDGTPVPLSVTVIPLLDDGGEFGGAVEILRPTEPDPGFLLAGRSELSTELRATIGRLARTTDHVVLVGEAAVCADVARAFHRLSGVADALYHSWPGSWSLLPEWPPGTVFAYGDGAAAALDGNLPEGWRVIGGVANHSDLPRRRDVSFEFIELPRAADLGEDLPLVLAAWIERLAPRTSVTPEALARLSRMARELGFERIQKVLHAAVGSAHDHLDETHIPSDGYGTELVDELLQESDPLAALEKRLIREVLDRSGWRMQEAADRLGISRVTLWRKLKDHGIERPESPESNQRDA